MDKKNYLVVAVAVGALALVLLAVALNKPAVKAPENTNNKPADTSLNTSPATTDNTATAPVVKPATTPTTKTGTTAPKTTTPPPTTAAKAVKAYVLINNFAFHPAVLTVKVGTIVIWTNNDSASHSIVGDKFNSAFLSFGNSFSYKFATKGTYNYSCGLHPEMTGRVVVE